MKTETIQRTTQEKRLKSFLQLLMFVYAAEIIFRFLPGSGSCPVNLKSHIFSENPGIKIAIYLLICFLSAADVRRFRPIILLFIVANFISFMAGALFYFFGHGNSFVVTNTAGNSGNSLFPYPILLDGFVFAVLSVLCNKADKSVYHLNYLTPSQFRALSALSEVAIRNEDESTVISPDDVAYNVDNYLFQFEAKTKWITKLALIILEIYPVFNFKAPLSFMQKDDRLDFLKKRFYRDIRFSIAPKWLAVYLQAMIRMGKQLCFMGYYNDTRVHKSIGYVPFSERPDTPQRLKAEPLPPPRKPLDVLTEHDISGETLSAEIVIIGSGAGASILAHGLVKEGKDVLLVERGNYEDPQTYTEDEMEMISRLYSDGAIQLSRDFRFQVIQGSCVGGSTVVNNAVCFDTPAHVLENWGSKELETGIDLHRFRKCQAEINKLIHVQTVPEMGLDNRLQNGGFKFAKGCKELGLDKAPNLAAPVNADIHNCAGCGYCNIGCKYDRKLSMLVNILPEAQATGRLRILAGCEITKLSGSGKSINAASGKFGSGRKIQIKGKKFVVSAGAVSSSVLLINSGIARQMAGKRLSFNMGCTMSAKFDEILNSTYGLQISHYLELAPSRGYVYETWYNPPMFQSIAMPGWFEDHYENMKDFNRMACVGVLVGTESNAQVRTTGLTGREIDFVPTQNDFDKMIEGLTLGGQIFLKAGAEYVMPNTFGYYKFSNKDELNNLKNLITSPTELTLGTGHPQGGNVMSNNSKIGTINAEMKVHGYDNLYVADASVFPTSIGVNPQVTVMTFGHYAVDLIK